MKISGIFKRIAAFMLAGAVCSGMSALAASVDSGNGVPPDTASIDKKADTLTEEGAVYADLPMSAAAVNSAAAFKSDVVTVGVRGRYYTSAAEAVARINEIRLEACREGIKNPANPSKKLTLTDYQPVRWSYELEMVARQRAAEACIRRDHMRPNDQEAFTLTVNSRNKGAEVLAWNGYQNMLYGIEQFYDEKEDYLYNTGKETGHYEALIDPDFTHVGLGGFFSVDCGVSYSSLAGRFLKSTSPMDGTYGPYVDEVMVPVEIKSKYLSEPMLVCTTGRTGAQFIGTSLTYEMCSVTTMDGENGKVYYIGDIRWTSSNPQVATVKDGTVTAVAEGKTTITAYNPSTGATVKIVVEVIPASLTVSLDKESVNLEVGSTAELKATVLPAEAPNKTLKWSSSDSTVVSVYKGRLTAKKVGTAVITATAVNGYKAECTVEVTVPPEKVELNKTSTVIGVGESEQLEAILPEHSTQGTLIWSSDNSAAVIVTNGGIKAQQTGTAVITVTTENGKSASCRVTVKEAPSEIVLNQKRIEMGVGEALTLKTTIPEGSASGTIRWSSSNENSVTVDNGRIIAANEGNSIIIVRTFNGKTAACTIVVKSAPEKVGISETEKTIGVGETLQLDAVIDENSASNALTWRSSDSATVKVSGGLVKGIKEGSATITLKTYNGKRATCTVNVKKAPAKVLLDRTAVTMGAGESVQLTYSLTEGSASEHIEWKSSDETVVTVKDGKITARKNGSAVVTVTTFNGRVRNCTINVKDAPSEVKLSVTKKVVGVGETVQLKATLSAGSASDSQVWNSSDEDIVKVEKGLVTAVGVGTATVRIRTFNGKYAICAFVVKEAPEEIGLLAQEATLGMGETMVLLPVLSANCASDKLTWSSSDTSVIAVKSGKIYTKGIGQATAAVITYNGKRAVCNVTVKAAPSTITMSTRKVILGVGESYQLECCLPEDSASSVIKWTTSNGSVASVNETTGKITAKQTGTAVITAKTFNGKTALCSVIVRDPPSKISLNETKKVVGSGEEFDLTVSLPAQTASASIMWASTNEDVAVVENGKIITKNPGTAIITVRTFNGVRTTCSVVVREAPQELGLNADQKTLGVGETCMLEAILPSGTASDKITWLSTDKTIANVVNGKVYAKAKGTVSIIANTYNGIRAVCTVTVKAAPASVTLNKLKKYIGSGDSFRLEAKLPAGTASDKLVWRSANEDIVTVDAAGKITAKAAGNANVYVKTFNGKSAACKVVVRRAPIDGDLTLSDQRVILGSGERYKLTAVLSANTVSDLTWLTSAESVAQIKSGGYITAVEPGTSLITVKTYNGLKATCGVVVREAPTDFTLSQQSVQMALDEEIELTAKLPSGTASAITWMSSDESVVRVHDGIVESVGLGRAYVTAETFNGISRSCSFEVLKLPEYIQLSADKLVLGEGQTEQLEYILPEGSISRSITWTSSNENAATVVNGKIKAEGAGTAEIKAELSNGVYAICTVTVLPAPTELSLSETRVYLGIGEEYTLHPDFGQDIEYTLTWTSSNTAVATVENGRLVAVGTGTTLISAKTYNGIKATCGVVVREAPTDFTLSQQSVQMALDEEIELTAKLPAGTASAITWTSSDESVVRVHDGIVESVGLGRAYVTAETFNGISRTCEFEVLRQPDSIVLSAEKLLLGEGQTAQLEYTIPEGSMTSSVSWSSSDENVVTVSDGKITAVGTGVVRISASVSNGVAAYCSVTVLSAPQDGDLSITDGQNTMSNGKIYLGVGETFKFRAQLSPNCASDVTWKSSNEDVFTVDDGFVTAVAPGVAAVTLKTFNGISVKCSVIVRDAPESISITEESVTIGLGERVQLNAKLSSGSASAVTWSSSDESVTVVNDGIVTGTGEGEALIIAETYNGMTAFCTVSVCCAPDYIMLSENEKYIGADESITLEYYIPDGSVSGVISWTSDDESVATVSNGKVKGIAPGIADITVSTYNGLSATCTVVVNNKPTEISLSETEKQVYLGDVFDLQVVFLNGEYSDKITWSVGNTDIAMVEDGTVVALSPGTTNVIAKTYNGIYCKCRMVVKAD